MINLLKIIYKWTIDNYVKLSSSNYLNAECKRYLPIEWSAGRKFSFAPVSLDPSCDLPIRCQMLIHSCAKIQESRNIRTLTCLSEKTNDIR